MINDADSVRLSEYCFVACQTLKNAIQGKGDGDLNESEKMAIGDLGRCVEQSTLILVPYQTTVG